MFAPRKYLYQNEATSMERPEMYSASRCNNTTYLCGTSKYPVSREAVSAQNGKLTKLGWTYRLGTVFVRRKYLYQKETTGRREKKCFPLVGAINPLTCADRQNTPSRRRRFGPRRIVAKIGTDLSPWYRVCTKEIFIPKGSYGHGETRNAFN